MKYFFSLVQLIICVVASSQVDHGYIQHLTSLGLQREHNAYLLGPKTMKSSPDSLHYYFSKYYLQYKDPENFIRSFHKSKSVFEADTNAMNEAGILMLYSDFQISKSWFTSIENINVPFNCLKMRLFFNAATDPRKTDILELPVELRADFMLYKRFYNRKPIVAGMLSAAVPGLGKLYAGRKRSFIFTFVTNTLFAVRSYETIKKLGYNHPFTICNLLFNGVFYAANVYGSYFELKRSKAEKRKQFLIHAADYSMHNYRASKL